MLLFSHSIACRIINSLLENMFVTFPPTSIELVYIGIHNFDGAVFRVVVISLSSLT